MALFDRDGFIESVCCQEFAFQLVAGLLMIAGLVGAVIGSYLARMAGC
jgi:hypothetical protein